MVNNNFNITKDSILTCYLDDLRILEVVSILSNILQNSLLNPKRIMSNVKIIDNNDQIGTDNMIHN